MADNVAMYGFRPYRGGMGSQTQYVSVRQPVVSNYDSNTPVGTSGIGFRAGDLVTQQADGTVAHTAVGDPSATVLRRPLGVVVGIDPWYDSTIGQSGAMRRADNLPTGIVYGTNFDRQSNLLILPIEGLQLEVDATGTVPTTYANWLAIVGANVPLIYSAVAPKAFPRIDVTTPVQAATAQFRVVGVSPNQANQDFSGLNVKLLVTVNFAQQAPLGTLGV